ncbi:MAG TPA: VOC family protein [Polyangiaceae bacterium]
MRRLHHVAIGSADVSRLAAFYRDVFGLTESARHHDGAGGLRSIWLDADGTLVMIERSDAPARRVEGVGTGPFLVAFAVSAAERERFERALVQRGQPIEARTEFTLYARDPDGNRVAVSHYPETAHRSDEL